MRPGYRPDMNPGRELNQGEQREAVRSLSAGLMLAEMSVEQLCCNAASLDGALGPADVREVLAGTRRCTAHEHDVLAQAINDRSVDRGENHPVRYSHELAAPGGN